MGQEKSVCFAGHRDKWRVKCSEKNLYDVIENLIKSGYTVFYDGNMGYFDFLCRKIVAELKLKYPNIKIIRVLNVYHYKKTDCVLPTYIDETVFPFIEQYHFKQKIIKRNEWIVDNCDVLVCHITEKNKSGAFRTVRYAEKRNKKIICL